MRTKFRLVTLAIGAILVAAACTSGASPTPVPSAPPSAAASAAPSVAPSVAPSEPPTPAPSPTPAATPTPDACAPANLTLVAAGKLTVGTDNPAYPPYYATPDSGKPPKPWQLGDPTNGKGFESAFAYALAEKLGFTKDQVSWIVVTFDSSYAPGAKTFDVDINQVSYTPKRAENVDLSDGYYYLTQSVVALKANAIAGAKSIGGLKNFRFGAQVGTTAYDAIKNVIVPTTKISVYSSNDAAIQALKAKQIDGLVVDLPTAFYVTAVQVDNGVIVGQFPSQGGTEAEHFSVVLAKASPLTACVNRAIAALKADGTLDAITKEWLADKANAPVFQP